MAQQKLAAHEEQQLVDLLKRLEPGFQPFAVFEQLARLVVLSIIEVVPLRMHDGQLEVLLIEKEDEPFIGQLHTPGTVVRTTDIGSTRDGLWEPFARLFHEELGDIAVGRPYFAGNIIHRNERGAEQAQVYWVEVMGEQKIGAYYPVDKLPENIIDSQRAFIAAARDSYYAATQQ